MSAIPLLPWFPVFNPSSAGVNPAYLITAASSLRLGHHLLSRRCSGHLHRFLFDCFSYQKQDYPLASCLDSRGFGLVFREHALHSTADIMIYFDSFHSGKLPRFTDIWCQSSDLLRHSLLDTFADTFSVAHSACFSFFSGNGKGSGNTNVRWGNSHSNSKRNSLDGRLWTSVLLAFNIMVYVAQVASQGRLILWGAKVNNLIDQGQLWRLATSSCLHANIGHLLVNSYSLNSIGPTVEKLTGARRFLAVYFASAIASSVMSYRCCQSPAVGASGAIFGLVGAYAVFVLRHRSLIGGGKSDIQDIARMIALNMTIGLLSNGIDNWGHLGGLLGGAAMAWFLGPAWRYDSRTADGRSVFVDRAPIFSFLNRRRLQ